MAEPLRFILNQRELVTRLPPGGCSLDFIRQHQRLTGTKIGCREGDCGACTVLVGDLENGELIYRSMTSCLMPLGNAHGKHLVTVEGLNMDQLSPVQQAIVDEGGTQCGFCTPGFVVSLTGFCLSTAPANQTEAVSAMDGNICRCTGYKSLERAAARVCTQLTDQNAKQNLQTLVENGFLPPYFAEMPQRLAQVKTTIQTPTPATSQPLAIGGGTDLLVQKPEHVEAHPVHLLYDRSELRGIQVADGYCNIGAATPTEDLRQSPLLTEMFSNMRHFMDLISSTPIRHMATVGGNLVNASPIGDLSIFFLALDATLVLRKGNTERTLPLREFFLDYKVLAKEPDETLAAITFKQPPNKAHFNFEKVCKRTYLDIATVNSAALIHLEDNRLIRADISAGGVAPVPKFLAQTSAFLKGQKLNTETLKQALQVADGEISPISDVRGTSDYKRLLLRQQILAHFHTLYPSVVAWEALV